MIKKKDVSNIKNKKEEEEETKPNHIDTKQTCHKNAENCKDPSFKR